MYFIIKKRTRVAHLMESHVRTFAHDSFEKACYFLLLLGKASSFWLLLGIFSFLFGLCLYLCLLWLLSRLQKMLGGSVAAGYRLAINRLGGDELGINRIGFFIYEI